MRFQADPEEGFAGDSQGTAMDNEGGESIPVGRKIALGLSDYIVQFAARRIAQIWEEFASEDPLRWRFYLLELVDDPGTTIYFNLHGINVRSGLLRAATGRATPTDWELFQISEHDSWWPRIEWWDEDTHPFQGVSRVGNAGK